MSIPDEEKPLTHSELAALAEDLDRQLAAEELERQAKLASKARGRANHPPGADRAKRSEVPDVPEKDLLAKWSGKKERPVFYDRRSREFRRVTEIICGPDGKTQLIFRPSEESREGVKELARWTVGLRPVPLSGYDTQREQSKAGRRLFDKEKGKASVAFKAVEQLLACHVEIERLRKLHLRRRLQQLLTWRLREKAKGEGVSLIKPDEAAEETPYTYPKPEVDTLREQLSVAKERLDRVEEQLDTEIDQRLRAQAAIGLVVEVLSTKELVGKLKIAFDMLRDDSQRRQGIEKLKWDAVALANKRQRPPTKAELRKFYDPDERMDPAQFSRLLNPAGLSWLPGAKSPRKLS